MARPLRALTSDMSHWCVTGTLSPKPVVVLWSDTVMALVVDLLCPACVPKFMLLPMVLGTLSPAEPTRTHY